MSSKKLIEKLEKKGIISQITNVDKLVKALDNNSFIYCGFDPTAKSLHLGNYVQIIALLNLKNIGFKPIFVLGGATGMIGDPSGRNSERQLLSSDQIDKNKLFIKKQLEFFSNDSLVLDNFSWTKNLSIIEFLRDFGKLLNINYMISKEQISSRIDSGISYTEFSYMLLQAYDFLYLYKNNNCNVQIGGSDQWGNITAGVEVIRKVIGDNNLACGLTFNLLTDSKGEKFGKSQGKAIWLDKTLTTPFELFQFLYNQPDDMLLKLFNSLTLMNSEDISNILNNHIKNPKNRYAQYELASWVVKYIHGDNELKIAINITNNLFKGDINKISKSGVIMLSNFLYNIKNPNSDVYCLIDQNVFKSRRELRDFIKNQALKINGHPIKENESIFDIKPLYSKYYLVQKGKKNFYILIKK